MPQTPGPSRSVEETLLTLDHLLGKMARAMEQQNDVMRIQLARLEAAVAHGVPADLGDAALAVKTDDLNYCIQECSEWLRNHQHAAEQHIRAIQELTEHVQRLDKNEAPPGHAR
ncbi:MAG: hypothetical protein EOO33_00135 [Comamonadaceae bacterium]|nr:MAG: hypothetical protein EOO33_00135 [Comamonadaceae bacterium]